MTEPAGDPFYVAARCGLLDALDALGVQRDAVILVGAQAVYLRATASTLPIAPFTRDADLAIDPGRLAAAPPIESLMKDAGFHQIGGGRIGGWERQVLVDGIEHTVEVDLMVPDAVAGGSGRRSVRLPGHDPLSARRTKGLEAALVDRDRLRVASLVGSDPRVYEVAVAGPAALLVAKVHKITERLDTTQPTDRSKDKDAADIYRLFQATAVSTMGMAVRRALSSPIAADVTGAALEGLRPTFGRRRAPGILMAARGAGATREEADVMEAAFVAYIAELIEALG